MLLGAEDGRCPGRVPSFQRLSKDGHSRSAGRRGLRSTEGGQPCTCNRGVLAIERLLSIAGMTINECHKGRIESVKHPGQIPDGFLPTQRQRRPFRCLRYTLMDPVSSSWKHDILHAPVPLV